MNQVSTGRRGEAAEGRGRQAVGQRETRGADFDRHDLGQRHDHRAVVGAVQEREPQLDHQQIAEAWVCDQPRQGRVSSGDGQHGRGNQQRLAADAIGERTHDRQPDEVGHTHADRHQQAFQVGQVQFVLAEGRSVGGDQVERHGGHHHQCHAAQHQAEVLADGAHHFTQRWAMGTGFELRGLFQRATDDEDRRHDQAADQERHAPAPFAHLLRAQPVVQTHAQQAGEDHGGLLAGGLPADEEAFAARCRDFSQIHRNATQFHTRRETLQQTTEQHQQRCDDTQCGVARHAGNQQSAHCHHREGDNQPFATPVTVDVSTEKNRAQRTHEEACAEGRQRQHQRSESAVGREEGFCDGRGVEAIDHEIEHLEEVTADNAKDRFALTCCGGHLVTRSGSSAWSPLSFLSRSHRHFVCATGDAHL
ncbi:hypothetical protein ALP62_05496 [Pseudomonas syringae pv. aceris]|nr:hypothetical protein ALP62_05496 [Pseudomonas syringae pv. aceris]